VTSELGRGHPAPDSVLIASATRRLVGAPFALDPVGSLRLKGHCAKIAHSQSKQYRFKSNQRFRMSQLLTNGSQWCKFHGSLHFPRRFIVLDGSSPFPAASCAKRSTGKFFVDGRRNQDIRFKTKAL
jgi:hypothetical protein